MSAITFTSMLPLSEILRALTWAVYEEEPPHGVPFLNADGTWYELSRANDHKLDMLGGCHYRYRDRYGEPARMARIRAVIAGIGVIDEVES